jgi:hypothetical protein
MASKKTDDDEQKQLKAFLKRRHPLFGEMQAHWSFLQQTYEGGRAWFESHIFKYLKEGTEEFNDRTKRAYRFNHTREVVDLVDKYLFKMEIRRNAELAPASVKAFWESTTLNGLTIHEFAKRVSNRASVAGRPWVLVDTNRTYAVRTKADEKKAGVRTYAYIVMPQFVLDMGYDKDGKLTWVLIQESERDDKDPIKATGEVRPRFRLWTTEFSQLFRVEGSGENQKVVKEPPVQHGLGEVPIIPADNVINDELYTSPALIADVAYLDRAVANYLSNMDAIIQDQTFSQLAMPAQGLIAGSGEDDDKLKKLVELGTKRVFTFNGEGNAMPFYLSPDVKQAQLILSVVAKIINEIYHSVGLAGERTKEDNSQGIDNSSGVAKAYDFERVNALLASKADSLERFENRLARLVALWNGEEKAFDKIKDKLVLYPDNFDVRGLYDELELAARLQLVDAPDSIRRKQMTDMVDKLWPQLEKKLRDEIIAELEEWPPDPIEMAGEMAKVTGKLEQPGAAGGDVKKQGKNARANALVNGK